MGGATPKSPEWRKLPMSLAELCIETTLRCGQSFRWRKINDGWHCVLQGRIVSLRQDPTHLHYRVTRPGKPIAVESSPLTPPVSLPLTCSSPTGKESALAFSDDDSVALLRSYFALSNSLSAMYEHWAASDANFARRATAFTGIRILNQDAWEALVAFICSSNNNISRITQMVHKLCIHYGPYVGTVEGEVFHDFPGPDALSGSKVESHLRDLGFGYRAKYIAETARIVSTEKPAQWLQKLRNPGFPAIGTRDDTAKKRSAKDSADPPTYKAAHEALLELAGVGPKVADCVCLMGLGWGEAVPVDTHVWQIAQRDYNFGKGGKSKTFSKAMYDAVGDHFRKIWGPQAGWAQSVLFTANLKSFSEQASAKASTVKVEESQESVTGISETKTNKRKVVVMESSIPKPEVNDSQIAVAKSSGTRASKRKRTHV